MTIATFYTLIGDRSVDERAI